MWILDWLGEADAISDHAINFVTSILDPDFLSKNSWLDDFEILALGKLMNRNWWSRRWVIKEAILAKDYILVAGKREVHLADFTNAVDIVRSRVADIRVSCRPSPYYAAY